MMGVAHRHVHSGCSAKTSLTAMEISESEHGDEQLIEDVSRPPSER